MKHEMTIGIAPYDDGSGYRAEVHGIHEANGEKVIQRMVTITQGHDRIVLAPNEWLELKRAVDTVMDAIFPVKP